MLICFFVLWLPMCAGTGGLENSVEHQVLSEETPKTEDSWFGVDKVKHFFGSALLTTVGFATAREVCRTSESHSLYWGSGTAFGIGVAKELHDLKSESGHPSFKDLTANALGIGFAALFINFIFIQ